MKVCHCGSSEGQTGLTLLFLDWNSKRDFTDAYKERSVSNG